MGQQQLLLIVLGVIIVGIAVVVGINVFSASSTSANRDAVISDLTTLSNMAQQYYRKPTSLGGGSNSFTDWSIPSQLATTGNGTYTASVNANQVVLTGTGNQTGDDGTNPVQVTMYVGANQIDSTIVVN